jgi:hypothetical protein
LRFHGEGGGTKTLREWTCSKTSREGTCSSWGDRVVCIKEVRSFGRSQGKIFKGSFNLIFDFIKKIFVLFGERVVEESAESLLNINGGKIDPWLEDERTRGQTRTRERQRTRG